MQIQTTCRNAGIHHVGLHATNPVETAEFYRDILEGRKRGQLRAVVESKTPKVTQL